MSIKKSISSVYIIVLIGSLITGCGAEKQRNNINEETNQEIGKTEANNISNGNVDSDITFTYTALGETLDCSAENAEINAFGTSSGKLNVECLIREENRTYSMSFAAFYGEKLEPGTFTNIFWQDFLDCDPKQSQCIGKSLASASTSDSEDSAESKTTISSTGGTIEITEVKLIKSDGSVQKVNISGTLNIKGIKLVVDGVGKDPAKAEAGTISGNFKNIGVTLL